MWQILDTSRLERLQIDRSDRTGRGSGIGCEGISPRPLLGLASAATRLVRGRVHTEYTHCYDMAPEAILRTKLLRGFGMSLPNS